MKDMPFTRPTIIAAGEFVARTMNKHAEIDRLALRLGLEEELAGGYIEQKALKLVRIVLKRPRDVVDAPHGSVTLAEAFVREAVEFMREGSDNSCQITVVRALARDGYVVVWEERGQAPTVRMALPDEVDLPTADDEIRKLLKHFGFVTPLGHLDQTIEAHTRGDWAAANSQLRTFLESLFDHIARYMRPEDAARRSTSENRRALLAEIDFLAIDRNEWTPDGKNYINGLFKMLHTEGSHPGLSDEDHSTFRLHIVLVTARTFLRRLHLGG